MNTRTYVIVLPLLLSIAALIGCIRNVAGDSDAPAEDLDVTSDVHNPYAGSHLIDDDHVTVDPRVLEELEESEWVEVHIEIRLPPGFELPSLELLESDREAYEEIILGWDLDVYDQLNAERRANVISALGPDLERRAGYFISASGLEKLRNHPYVGSVIWRLGGEAGSESAN